MGISSISNGITLLGRIFDTQKIRRPVIPDVFGKPACRPLPVHQPLPRVRPEEVGMDSRAVAAFLKELHRDETLNMHSLLILRNGKIAAEAVFGEHNLQIWKQTYSACKSITALAVGLVCAEGLLSPDDRLTDLFDGKLPPIARLGLKDLTVRHLLTMSTGASFNEASVLTERDWVKGYLSGNFAQEGFAYNSLNTYMLSVLVKEKTGQSLTEYLKPRLFDPLGIEEYYWETCPMGIEKGGWGLYMRPEDMAKIGVLVMNGGQWNKKQIIPAEWIAEASHTQISTGSVSSLYDYGYQIWTGRSCDSFLFNGMLGQNVLGFRKNGILLVSNAGNEEMFQSSNYFTAAERYFSGDLPDSLPQDDAAYGALTKTISHIREHLPPQPEPPKTPAWQRLFRQKKPALPADPLPPECRKLSGMRFSADDPNAPSVSLFPLILQVVQNNYGSGFSAVSFLRQGNTFYMTYAEEEASYLLPIGFGLSEDTDLRIGGVPYHVKTLGSFVRDEDGRPIFKIRITFCETPVTRYIKLYYTGAAPHMKQYETPGGGFVSGKLLGMKNVLAHTHVLSGTLERIDSDYIHYRIEKAFSPDIRVKRSE